jgi:hypothetical protein
MSDHALSASPSRGADRLELLDATSTQGPRIGARGQGDLGPVQIAGGGVERALETVPGGAAARQLGSGDLGLGGARGGFSAGGSELAFDRGGLADEHVHGELAGAQRLGGLGAAVLGGL